MIIPSPKVPSPIIVATIDFFLRSLKAMPEPTGTSSPCGPLEINPFVYKC